MQLQLRISGHHYDELKNHLLPIDGKEAVAVALCGRFSTADIEGLLVHDLTLIPHNECHSREPDVIHWPTSRIKHYFEKIGQADLAILKIHSHPGGYDKFSLTDDLSDREFFTSAFGWATNDKPHASAVMLPSGKIFGRFFRPDLQPISIDKISIIGDSLTSFCTWESNLSSEFAMRTIQTFGERTYLHLKNLAIAVVGCSGTGSPVIEQLTRLGVGKLVIVDPDIVEEKNLNRILNSTIKDAQRKKAKVKVVAETIKKIGLGTQVRAYSKNLYEDTDMLREIAACDVVFGCMDSVDGRHLLNQLSSFYLLPFFDLGVKLEADGIGGIKQICGTVHYVQPHKSSLLTRGVYTIEDLRAASQFRKNRAEYENLSKSAYIKNVNVNNPAVISVNMQIASHAINEFLNRIHQFKSEPPSSYAASTIDITSGYIVNSEENSFEEDFYLKKKTGRGDILPFIEMPELVE